MPELWLGEAVEMKRRRGTVALVDRRARPSQIREIRLSDRQRQLIEGGRQGHAGQSADSEFVVATTQVLDEGVSSNDDAGLTGSR
ncbi:MAG: hypothetical protein ACLQPH_11485 [Acidimicrobiales bacterium]